MALTTKILSLIMIIEGEDGITHINVYSKGKLKIGRWLSNFSYTPISLDDGDFNSIEGYWYWLFSGDDRFKILSGHDAKTLGKEVVSKEQKIIDESFKEKIKKAIDIKLKKYLDKSETLCNYNLPLCHYYDYKGKRVDAGHEWLIEHIEYRREMLREYFKAKI
jgi:hypothetical protein